jgi:hypothetical protein
MNKSKIVEEPGYGTLEVFELPGVCACSTAPVSNR